MEKQICPNCGKEHISDIELCDSCCAIRAAYQDGLDENEDDDFGVYENNC